MSESKYQGAYDASKKKQITNKINDIKDKIQDLQSAKNAQDDPEMKQGIDDRIKTLNIKLKSYQSGDPIEEEDVEEESQAGITTGSAGSISTYGGAGNYAPKLMMFTRHGKGKTYSWNPKKKKKVKESFEYLDNKISSMFESK